MNTLFVIAALVAVASAGGLHGGFGLGYGGLHGGSIGYAGVAKVASVSYVKQPVISTAIVKQPVISYVARPVKSVSFVSRPVLSVHHAPVIASHGLGYGHGLGFGGFGHGW